MWLAGVMADSSSPNRPCRALRGRATAYCKEQRAAFVAPRCIFWMCCTGTARLGRHRGVRRSGERGWKEIVGLRPGDRVVVDGRQSVPAARAHGASAGCSAIASGSAPTGSPRWRSGLSVIVVQKRWLATGFRTLVHATPPRSPTLWPSVDHRLLEARGGLTGWT